ncbi:MAG: OsmC family protein [Pseudomonadota bacterium]
MKISYIDGFKFAIENRGLEVITDQRSSEGAGEGLEPVEFLGAALGGCVAFYAVDYLRRNELATDGFRVDIEWTGAVNPKRIGGFDVKVRLPGGLTDRQRASLSRIVKACTVHKTLEHPPEIQVELVENAG